jgi:asparagine synthase (glutamine-hydrolysing)
VADLVPPEILDRPKMGFGIPVSRWLRGELRPLLEETLLSTAARQRGLFEPSTVRSLVDAHTAGRADHGPRLWLLLMLELWAARFL